MSVAPVGSINSTVEACVERRQHGVVGCGQVEKVVVGGLSIPVPAGEDRHGCQIGVIGQEGRSATGAQMSKYGVRVVAGQVADRRVHQHPDQAGLRHRRQQDAVGLDEPTMSECMVLVPGDMGGDEHVDIGEISALSHS